MVRTSNRWFWAACAMGAATLIAGATPSFAQKLKTVRFGKAVPTAFTFTPVDVGVKEGIWKKLGLNVEILSFHGDGQLQQALASNSVDFGIGSGPGMGYHSKGVPAIAVAAAAGPPKNMALIVSAATPFKSVDDMKGKKIGVTTAGSLTDWLVKELSRKKGWTGAAAMKALPMGATRARLAAMKTGAIDGMIGTTDEGYQMEAEHTGRLLMTMGDIVKPFITHVLYARDSLVKNDPATVKAFLKGWFQTIQFMKAHKKTSIQIAAKVLNAPPAILDKSYGAEMGMMSDDGVFDPAAVKLVAKSLVDLGILKSVPSPKQMYTDQFVPVKLSK